VDVGEWHSAASMHAREAFRDDEFVLPARGPSTRQRFAQVQYSE
jgi:hypothetical protein